MVWSRLIDGVDDCKEDCVDMVGSRYGFLGLPIREVSFFAWTQRLLGGEQQLVMGQ